MPETWAFGTMPTIARMLYFPRASDRWAIASILVAARLPRVILLQQDPTDPGKFIELMPRKECLMRKGETGFALLFGNGQP